MRVEISPVLSKIHSVWHIENGSLERVSDFLPKVAQLVSAGARFMTPDSGLFLLKHSYSAQRSEKEKEKVGETGVWGEHKVGKRGKKGKKEYAYLEIFIKIWALDF